jgi:hypothetical protein
LSFDAHINRSAMEKGWLLPFETRSDRWMIGTGLGGAIKLGFRTLNSN